MEFRASTRRLRSLAHSLTRSLAFLLLVIFAHAGDMDQLRIGVLRWGAGAEANPYPTVWREVARSLESSTSIEVDPLIKEEIRPIPADLSRHALVFWMISPGFTGWTAPEREALRDWVTLGGGMMVVSAVEGTKGKNVSQESWEALDRRVRSEISLIFDNKSLEVIPSTHAVFRSFFLVRQMGGVLVRSRSMEGVKTGERFGLVYTPNDLLGALLRDSRGNYLMSCYPGGESQRKESYKLVVNLFLYALTGTYKQDIIHSPFIQQKLLRQP